MPDKKSDIKTRTGKINENILVIAPHGHADNDKNTGKLTLEIQRRLGCHAIINDVYQKPKEVDQDQVEGPDVKKKILDLNSFSQAKLHKEFIKQIEGFIQSPESTYVIWIHSINDEILAAEATKLQAEGLKGLVCYGQPDRLSIEQSKAEDLATHLNELSFKVAFTSDDSPSCRGWAEDSMNQFFRNPENGLQGVQSLQLRISSSCLLDENNLYSMSGAIAAGIAKMTGAKTIPVDEQEVDDQLVENASIEIQKLIEDNNAMATVGNYLLETFYEGNFEWAKNKKGNKDKSLRAVMKKLDLKGHVPCKTWFYDAVRLVVDEHEFASFRTYGMLGHSHKVYLTHVNDIEEKKKLIEEVVDERLTVKELRERIRKIKEQRKSDDKKEKFASKEDLKNMPEKKRVKEKEKIEKRVKELEEIIENLKNEMEDRKREYEECEMRLREIEVLEELKDDDDQDEQAA